MEFRVLGQLEVVDRGRSLEFGAGKPSALLGVLLLHANEAVPVARLVDELWGDAPPASAAKLVQGYVSTLRRALGAEAVVTRARGYLVRAGPDGLDAARFERLAGEGQARRDDDPAEAARRFREALGLWRGPPLEGLTFGSLARNEVERLSERRLAVLEQRIDVDLVLGRHAELIAELRELAAGHPYRERLRAQLMLALYRSGRQAEGLAVYRETRRLLADELGLEPGRELQRLERQILAHAPELDPPHPREAAHAPVPTPPSTPAAPTPPSTPAAAATSAVPATPTAPTTSAVPAAPTTSAVPAAPTTPAARRLVTVAVAGLVGDTALTERLDPESMHRVVDRHWQICTDVFRRHGGTVQAAAGDVVVGVVGLTELHEDDALRAVRAALELRDAVTAFGRELERDFGVRVTGRCGIDSGEVFVGAGTRREAFATGDAVDRAIRLEQAAADGDILLGEGTYRLVEPAVRAEAREPVDLGRRVVPVPTWRLRGTRADDAAPVHPATPFVGRHRELTALRAELARAVRESACRLVTVVGPAGIGKSRLASELAADLGERATVAVGHCLAYGEGITYRPLAEIVGQVTGGHPPARIADVLRGADPSGVIARRVLGAVGLSCEPTHAEEMFWAVRRLFEWAAQQRPLVAVVEDIHRAEPTLLDLLDHLVAFSSGAAILLVCLARPELTESRPTWVVPEHNRSVLVLEPLDEPDAYRLVEALGADGLDRATMTRAVETAEGNPLFLEQLVAVRPTAGGQRLPPTIQALLAARIDRLEPGERRVLAYGSVEGRSFHRAAVTDLLPEAERGDSGTRLMSLVRKQLIRPDRPQFATGDAFRFAHTLIRDAAYEGLPKELRSRLHERMAGWLRTGPGAPDELIGYHLERAYRLRGDLGRIGERERALAAEAAGRLDAAARAALLRGDLPAGAGLLERAVQVLAPDDPARSALLPRLGAALFDAGRLADADRVLEEAVRRAGEQDSPPLAALARVERQRVRLQVEPRQALTTTDDVARHALEVLARHGDELGQCRAWCLRASVRWTRGRSVDADGAWQRAADHARRAGDDRELFEILGWRASAAAFGPLPVPEAIRRCTRIREQVRDSPVAVAVALHPLGLLHALRGDLDRARRVIREGNTILDELGRTQSTVSHHECLVELLAGRPAVAERRLRAGYEKLRATGEGTLLAATAAMLARALHAQGRDEEAEWECGVSQRYAATGDQPTQVMWRGVRARILARRGRLAEAEALAREAVRLAEPTDLIVIRGDALLDLADVLDAAARPRAADAAVRQGLALYERKGAVLPAGRARSRLVMPGRMPTG